MTRSWVQTTPFQWHGVESVSDQVVRVLVGSTVIADLRARRERPSELRENVEGMKKNKKKNKK